MRCEPARIIRQIFAAKYTVRIDLPLFCNNQVAISKGVSHIVGFTWRYYNASSRNTKESSP